MPGGLLSRLRLSTCAARARCASTSSSALPISSGRCSPGAGGNGATPPKGATGDGGFTVTPEMMSILGCSPDELGDVLKALGFRLDRRPIKAERGSACVRGMPLLRTAKQRLPEAAPAETAPTPEANADARRRRPS